MNQRKPTTFGTYETFRKAALAELKKNPNVPAVAELLDKNVFDVWKIAREENIIPGIIPVKAPNVAAVDKLPETISKLGALEATAVMQKEKQKPSPRQKLKTKSKSSLSRKKPIGDLISAEDYQKLRAFLEHNPNAIQAARAIGIPHYVVCRIAEEKNIPVIAGLRPRYKTPRF